MKKQYTLIAILFICKLLFSQTAPGIEWQNTIGGASSDGAYSIFQTTDGGYILGGYSNSNSSSDKSEDALGAGYETEVGGFQDYMDYWVIKLDATGNIEWENTIGGGKDDRLHSVQQTSDGGYILGGHSYSGTGFDKTQPAIYPGDLWIVKINATGTIEWQKTIGGAGNDFMFELQQTTDGGYILGNASWSGISYDKTEPNYGLQDIWVIKLNAIGAIEWQKSIGGDEMDALNSIQQTTDGGYILGGWSKSGISGNKTEACIGLNDFWIIKLDASGNIVWQNTIGGNSADILYDINQTSDGGYIAGGDSFSSVSGDKITPNAGLDCWILKLDAEGNIDWQKTIGGSSNETVKCIFQTVDGGYVFGANSTSGISGDKTEECFGGYDYWIVKLNTVGDITWQKTIGGNALESFTGIIQTSDNGFAISGYSQSEISGNKTEARIGLEDYWIVKLFPEEVACSLTSSITPAGPTSFCTGENVILNAPVDASYSYQWKKNGVNISGATTSGFTANNTGQYQVYIASGACNDISDSLSVVKNPKPNPVITNLDATNDLCFDSSIKLKTASGAGYSYQWYKGASAISGATSFGYFANMPGNYKVKVTNSFGCSKISTAYNIIKTCRLGDSEASSGISVYPNPANGNFTIDLIGFDLSEPVQLKIVNMLGEAVYSVNLNSMQENYSIELDNGIPNGHYIIELRNSIDTVTDHLVISR